MSLDGMRVVVTGGSRGIGAAAARALAERGADVLAVARGAEDLGALARDAGVTTFAADVSTQQGVRALADHAHERWGEAPDALVHAAGAFALAPLVETAVADFDRMIGANLRAAFLLARAWLPGMVERGAGHLCWVGSVAGRIALPGNAAYSASKFGLRGLHEVLDAETRGTGVRCTLVEPSATATSLWEEVDRDRYTDLPPADAMLDAAAVAEAIVWALERPASVAVSNVAVRRA